MQVTKLGAMIADIGGAAVWKACKEGAQEWEIASEGVKAMKVGWNYTGCLPVIRHRMSSSNYT